LKHLILTAVLLLGAYFGWKFVPVLLRNRVRQFIRSHLLVVVVILLACFTGLGIQFYLSSARIL
jgi:hypothetical protein